MIAVATPYRARVLLPVDPSGDRTRVSLVIAIVQLVADPPSLTKVIAVPIGKATEAFAGIVHVLAVVSDVGR